MAKEKVKRISILGFLGLQVILYIFLFCCYKGKKVHLSLDDVSISMKELTKDSTVYASIFEHSFFKKIKILHQCCGAKFTLYIYEEDGTYRIDDFPEKYRQELGDNHGWLRFGYHAQTPTDSIPQYSVFKDAFNHVDSNLYAKFGGGSSKTLRLHYFYASHDMIEFLKRKGITTLLTSDDRRISYSLQKKENDILLAQDDLSVDGIRYVRTDIRVERDGLACQLFKHCFDKELVVFAHEWALYSSRKKWLKLEILLFTLRILGCDFIIN